MNSRVCPCCHRSLPKKRVRSVVKKTVRKYEDGIKKYPDGREICLTKVAWDKRRDEVFERDMQYSPWDNWPCAGCGEHKMFRPELEVDHIRKRSLGRDDRLSNLQLLCKPCHRAKHDEFRSKRA